MLFDWEKLVMNTKISTVTFLLFILSLPSFTYADDGITDKKILFGQTAALGGPAAALGKGMNAGILAAFKEVNAEGGVNGRMLELIAHDDGYEPDRAIENTKKLIHDDRAFALIGGVGTPTANAIEPIISREKVPFIGPFTGAEFLRNPFNRYVINIRGSYWQETEEWIERLTKDLGITRIGILYQDDTYGRAGLSGVQKALSKRGLSLVGEATYKRNTVAVKSAVLSLRKVNPEAVVMVGAYKPCAEFIKVSQKLKFKPKFVNISFVGSDALSNELKTQGDGVIISQVVPFPFDRSGNGIVKNYQNAMQVYNSELGYGFVSLEGYMVGRLVIKILRSMEGDVTREGFLDTLYTLKDITLDDITLRYGPQDNQGMDKVFMTILQKDSNFISVEKLSE